MWRPWLGCFHESSLPLSHGWRFQVGWQGSGFIFIFPLIIIVQIGPTLCARSLPGVDSALMGAERLGRGEGGGCRWLWGLTPSLLFLVPPRGLLLGSRTFFPPPSVHSSICSFLCLSIHLFKTHELRPCWREALWWLWGYTERRGDLDLAFEELNAGREKRHEPK